MRVSFGFASSTVNCAVQHTHVPCTYQLITHAQGAPNGLRPLRTKSRGLSPDPPPKSRGLCPCPMIRRVSPPPPSNSRTSTGLTHPGVWTRAQPPDPKESHEFWVLDSLSPPNQKDPGHIPPPCPRGLGLDPLIPGVASIRVFTLVPLRQKC